MSIKLGNTAINKAYLGSTEIKKMYLGTNLILDNGTNDTVVTINTTSSSSGWTPTSIVNSGATLTWEVTGDVTPIAPQVIDKPILNLSSNTGTAVITITSSTAFVGLTEMWFNNGTTSLEITTIDISEATALTKIDLFNNNLTTIDISANTALVNPWVQSNTLTAFDPSTNVLAEFIAVDTNSLTALDISANVLLTDLWAYDNLLTTAELDAIINDLDTNGLSNGVVKLAGNTGLPLTAASGTAYDALVGKGWNIDVAKYTPVDTTDPVIGTLAYANESDTTVELSMSVASTDNIAVVEHWIYKDYVFEEIVTGATFSGHEITGLIADTNYDFTCVAYDAAGNFSLTSNVVNFTTDSTPTPPASDDLRPILSNFHIKKGVLNKLYFDSSEIITASTGVNGYTGFTITDKVISQITINTGLLVDHYFDVTVDFDHYSNNTIRYEGGSDIADSESNGVYDFLITDIDNQIVEPTTSSTYYVDKSTGSNGDNGTTEGLAWETITYAATQATAGDLIYIKAADYGAENVVISASGTLANPIKFIGYTTTPGDSPSLTREIDLAFDSAEMPLLTGVGTDSGIYADFKEYIFIKNIQVENYLNNININHSSYVVCDNIYSKDADNPLRMVLSPSFGMRVLNSYVADATSHGMWMYGAHHRIDNCWAVSSRILNMDYHISYNAGSLENGYNIIKDCYIHSYWDDSHGDHGISIKGEPSNLSEYTLVENCTLENNGQGIEFRHENSKRNVARGCYATRTADKITAARDGAALVTFRDGCTHNTVIDCNMDTLSYGIYFNDNAGEEGSQAGGHYNKVINSVFENNDSDIAINSGIGGTALEPTNNEFLNCTFYNSNKLISTSLVPFGATNKFINCILESIPSYDSSPSFSYSDFYVSFPTPSGTGNISFKPYFTDLINGNYNLSTSTTVEVYAGGVDAGVYYDNNTQEAVSPFSMGAFYYDPSTLRTLNLQEFGITDDVADVIPNAQILNTTLVDSNIGTIIIPKYTIPFDMNGYAKNIAAVVSKLRGLNKNTSTLKPSTGSNLLDEVDGMILENFKWETGTFGFTSQVFLIGLCSNIEMRNIIFSTKERPFKLEALTSTGLLENITIENCDFIRSPLASGGANPVLNINVNGATNDMNILIQNNYFEGGTQYQAEDADDPDHATVDFTASGIRVLNNTIVTSQYQGAVNAEDCNGELVDIGFNDIDLDNIPSGGEAFQYNGVAINGTTNINVHDNAITGSTAIRAKTATYGVIVSPRAATQSGNVDVQDNSMDNIYYGVFLTVGSGRSMQDNTYNIINNTISRFYTGFQIYTRTSDVGSVLNFTGNVLNMEDDSRYNLFLSGEASVTNNTDIYINGNTFDLTNRTTANTYGLIYLINTMSIKKVIVGANTIINPNNIAFDLINEGNYLSATSTQADIYEFTSFNTHVSSEIDLDQGTQFLQSFTGLTNKETIFSVEYEYTEASSSDTGIDIECYFATSSTPTTNNTLATYTTEASHGLSTETKNWADLTVADYPQLTENVLNIKCARNKVGAGKIIVTVKTFNSN